MAPPRTTVRNDQILAAIDALSRQVQARDEPLEARLDEVTVTLTDVARRQAALEQMVAAALTKEAKRDSCPFRDDIVAGANKERRLSVLEEGYKEIKASVHKVELRIAGWSVLAGGAMTAITALVEKIVEAVQGGGA